MASLGFVGVGLQQTARIACGEMSIVLKAVLTAVEAKLSCVDDPFNYAAKYNVSHVCSVIDAKRSKVQ